MRRSRSNDRKQEKETKEKHIEKKKKNHRPVKQLPNARPPCLEEEPPAPPPVPPIGQPSPAFSFFFFSSSYIHPFSLFTLHVNNEKWINSLSTVHAEQWVLQCLLGLINVGPNQNGWAGSNPGQKKILWAELCPNRLGSTPIIGLGPT